MSFSIHLHYDMAKGGQQPLSLIFFWGNPLSLIADVINLVGIPLTHLSSEGASVPISFFFDKPRMFCDNDEC